VNARRLRIGVPPGTRALPGTGAGRVWDSGLRELRRLADVREADPAGRAGRLRRGRPDVWLTVADHGPVAAREPVVALVHGAAWALEAGFWDHVPRRYAEPVIERTEAALRRAALAIAPSEYARRGLAATGAIDPDAVAVVPHGVDPATFHPGAGGGAARVAAALGERPYVLFASVPTARQKNLAALREAMALLADEGLPHALVIAGGLAGAPPEEEVARATGELPGNPGRVAWLGAVDDATLAALMAEAAACCLPSLFEAFGLTALEALACGAPVVAAERGALPEVVGDAGVLCAPTPAALAAALGRVLTDAALAAELRRAARARAATMPWSRTATGWLDALRRAAG
jgi:glycosyltransferase involved in cell wall biosynthesis